VPLVYGGLAIAAITTGSCSGESTLTRYNQAVTSFNDIGEISWHGKIRMLAESFTVD